MILFVFIASDNLFDQIVWFAANQKKKTACT